jgi:NADH-quinone oxidoreductase subunit G
MTAPKAPPKHPGFVTVTVDGKELVAKPGVNMVDAVKDVGADIPYYCYHHRLSIAANCRMAWWRSAPRQARPCLPDPAHRGDGHPHQNARVQEARGGDGVLTPQSPGRLRHL